MNRREMKAQARHQLRRQYWMIVVICLFAAFFEVEYSSSMWGINFDLSSFTVTQPGKGWTDSNLSDVFRDFLPANESNSIRNKSSAPTPTPCSAGPEGSSPPYSIRSHRVR